MVIMFAIYTILPKKARQKRNKCGIASHLPTLKINTQSPALTLPVSL
jgi:hypothetical protein